MPTDLHTVIAILKPISTKNVTGKLALQFDGERCRANNTATLISFDIFLERANFLNSRGIYLNYYKCNKENFQNIKSNFFFLSRHII